MLDQVCKRTLPQSYVGPCYGHFLSCYISFKETFFHKVVRQFCEVLMATLGEKYAAYFFYSMRKTLNKPGTKFKSLTIAVVHKITSIEFNCHRQACLPRPRIDA